MLICAPRVGHIFQHHLANLQGGFSKSYLQNFNVSSLLRSRLASVPGIIIKDQGKRKPLCQSFRLELQAVSEQARLAIP